MLSILRFKTDNQKLFLQALSIRGTVFILEQDVDPEMEHDAHEDSSVHYIAFIDKKPVGTARWRETNNGIKLERFAVLKEYRNQKLGTELLNQVMHDVLPMNKKIYLHAQENAIRFYRKHDFEVVGEPFEEAEILHYRMVFNR